MASKLWYIVAGSAITCTHHEGVEITFTFVVGHTVQCEVDI